MAAAAHVTANVYGLVQGDPPYIGTTSTDAFTRLISFSTPQVMSFPISATFVPVFPGQRVGQTSNYIYSVIIEPPSGLNVHGTQYGAGESVATLATLAS